jgi:short-subunit dehydrogenase
VIALVTGASSGIGEATARQLASILDTHVIVTARRHERLDALARTLPSATALAAALTEPDTPARVAALIVERYERLDLLINNAGASWPGSFMERGHAGVERHMDLNFRAPVRLTEALLPVVRASSPSAIINVASVAGRVPRPAGGGYSAS